MTELLELFKPPLPLWLILWGLVVVAPVAVLCLVLSALLERSGPIRLRHWAEDAGDNLRRLYEAPARFEAFRFLISLGARLLPVVAVVQLWALLSAPELGGGPWLALALVAASLAFVEWFNRALVKRHSEKALERLSIALRAVYGLSWPAIWVLARFFGASEAPEEEDEDDASEEEIDAYIDVGRREGILEPEEEELVRSIVDFGDTQVRRVMTPRVDIVSAPVEASHEELADIFFASKHARLPLYRESIDQIVGILHIRDLFEAFHRERPAATTELINPPHYVPESKPLHKLLEELQNLHQQMAIVVDEYGGVAGLVTVEDLVEEIVGEINDEHEVTGRLRVRLGKGRWRLRGRTDIDELDEIFNLDFDLDELPYETVSGLICGELGGVPKAGEEFETHGLAFAIEDADARRVTSVVVRRAELPESVEA